MGGWWVVAVVAAAGLISAALFAPGHQPPIFLP